MLLGRVTLAALLAGAPLMAAEPKAPEPAALSVSGLGWWSNREQRLALERILGDERGAVMGANSVEDAVFMIVSAQADSGYLNPKVTVRLTLEEGGVETHGFDADLETLLPRTLKVKSAHFEIEKGVRSVVDKVVFTGLTAMKEETARGYFRPGEVPLVGAEARAYSPSKLRRSAANLQAALHEKGYAESLVKATVTHADRETGRVEVAVDVQEGAKWVVRAIEVTGAEGADVDLAEQLKENNQPWSHGWQQDLTEGVRQAFYRKGYADVRVSIDGRPAAPAGGERTVTASIAIIPGGKVKVGEVRFDGNVHTKESILKRRVNADEGDPLNPLRLERARYRLARLGAFETVDLRYEPATGDVRDPVFTVRELPRWDASLLAGYGSYEQLRGGVELQQTNLLGRAHSSRLQLIQSMKSTRGDYIYSVPELFGESIDGSVRLFGLRREEEAFLREEYGGTAAIKRRVPWIKAEGTVGYTYQSLRNMDNELTTSSVDEGNVRVASIDLGLTKDRRDNPLRPRRGYRWFAQAELASERLGGEVDYQAFEMGVAYHTSWDRSRWIHIGLTHGVITQLGAPDGQLIPVNRRFYPGGDSSIRGYQKDEAAPRGADGRFVGAETYVLLNVEIEQAITKTWSVVVFGDALGQAAELSEYPFDERLYSVGLGLRYQTVIGPVRLEYGRNVNPRPKDPSGTLHLSVGFPF
ncbi:MAG: BamA/TamA family outer membrane protein [Rariglobus sp.]